MKNRNTTIFTTILVGLAWCALWPKAKAVSPPPDGGYPGGNTAEGQNALLSLTAGGYNTAVGYFSLSSNTAGQFNTALGAGALLANVGDPNSGKGVQNTASGAGALLSNTTGAENTATGAFALLSNVGGPNFGDGSFNSAFGAYALMSNTSGYANSAFGVATLQLNSTGFYNTAAGQEALFSNTTGANNTGIGSAALVANTTGSENTSVGAGSMIANTTGVQNTATGNGTLFDNTIGNADTAIGYSALSGNTTGGNNTAIGYYAGSNQTTGSNNVYIGAGINGVAGESNTCRIASIFGQTAANGSAVFITSGNKLGTDTSSKRFKEDIKPMNDASEALLALQPVTFRYKKTIDPEGRSQFGLVAEEVEKVSADLVVRDKEGKAYSVRYDQVNAMLLNEFLKEHKLVQELNSTLQKQASAISQQQARIDAMAVALQKVSDEIQMGKPAPQVVSAP